LGIKRDCSRSSEEATTARGTYGDVELVMLAFGNDVASASSLFSAIPVL
jgi:hypothetical protein